MSTVFGVAAPPGITIQFDETVKPYSHIEGELVVGRFTASRPIQPRLENRPGLLHALRVLEVFYHEHTPHQGIANARPSAPLPEPVTDLDRLGHLIVHRHDHLGGILRQ